MPIIKADEVLADQARLAREMLKIYRKLTVDECILIKDLLCALSKQRDDARREVVELRALVANTK